MTAVCATSSGVSRPKTFRILSISLARFVSILAFCALPVAHLHAAPQNSTGTPQSDELKQLRQKGEQGDVRAQFELGFMYFTGDRVGQNFAEAAKWWRRAAEQESPLAQLNLGAMYQKGVGVPRDDVQAVQWFRKAAEQGDATAENNLGDLPGNIFAGGRTE